MPDIRNQKSPIIQNDIDFYKELRRREYFVSPSELKKLKKRRKKATDGGDLRNQY